MKAILKSKGRFTEFEVETKFPIYVIDCNHCINGISINYLRCDYTGTAFNNKKIEGSVWKKFSINLDSSVTLNQWLEGEIKWFEAQLQGCLNKMKVPKHGDIKDNEYLKKNFISMKDIVFHYPKEYNPYDNRKET